MTGLTEKTCVPCRGGVPPLEQGEAQKFLAQTPGWELQDRQADRADLQVQEFSRGTGFRRPGRRARRGRGSSPRHHVRLGLRHGLAAHPQDQGPARERFYHGCQDQPAGARGDMNFDPGAEAHLTGIGPRPDLPPEVPPAPPPEILPDTPPEAPPEPPVKEPPGTPPGRPGEPPPLVPPEAPPEAPPEPPVKEPPDAPKHRAAATIGKTQR